MVAVLILMVRVVLVPLRGAVHLPEEPGVLRAAIRVVGAVQPHRGFELEIARIGGRQQVLLLLQYGEQHLLADAARLSRFVDDRRGGFLAAAVICLAILVRRLRLRVEGHGLQTFRAAAPRALLVENGLHLLLAHRIAVEEQSIVDDVARIEVVLRLQLVLRHAGHADFHTPADETGQADDQRDRGDHSGHDFRDDGRALPETGLAPLPTKISRLQIPETD